MNKRLRRYAEQLAGPKPRRPQKQGKPPIHNPDGVGAACAAGRHMSCIMRDCRCTAPICPCAIAQGVTR